MIAEIRSYNDLLEFIKQDFVTSKEAITIVSTALNVFSMLEMTKDEVVKNTEYYINSFCNNDFIERPLFLEQKQKNFDIKDIYKDQ